MGVIPQNTLNTTDFVFNVNLIKNILSYWLSYNTSIVQKESKEHLHYQRTFSLQSSEFKHSQQLP